MESFDRNLDGYDDVGDQLPRYLRERAADRFETIRAEKDAIDTVEAHERRVERCREAFLEALGGLPGERPPLDARSTGPLRRDGYTVETVVFQSLSDFHVTATFYRPQGDGPFPGALFLCGHAAGGKADPAYQRACIELTREGIATLAIDPVGQGERVQSYDPATDTVERTRATEHTYLGLQCRLAGTNLARYLVWDAVRALDYLEDRPDVDDSRLGVLGNSGGGTQTMYLLLVDERPTAAAPCCTVTSREAYMTTGQAQDSEQILDGAISRGLDFDDFLAAFAPNPLLVGCARSDFFPIEGAHESVDRVRAVYDLYGRPDAVEMAVVDRTHGLSPPLRTAAVRWLRDHLCDPQTGYDPGDPAVEDPETLYCTERGQVHAEFERERHVVDLTRSFLRDRDRTQASVPTVADETAYRDEIRSRVRDTLDLDRVRGPLYPRRIAVDVDEKRDVQWEKVFFVSEPGIVVAGIIARARTVPDRVQPTVVLPDHGTLEFESHRDRVATLGRDRGLALAFDPRGVGAVRAREVNTPALNGGTYFDYFGTEYKLGSDALMLGASLFGMRVFDVLRAREYLADRIDGGSSGGGESADSGSNRVTDGDGDGGLVVLSDPDGYGVEGTGVGAMHALYAAAAEPQFRSVRLADLPGSFHEMATEREYDLDFRLRVSNVVGDCDVPQLLPSLADRDVTWVGTDPGRFR
jgi:dienelactone hydrolase